MGLWRQLFRQSVTEIARRLVRADEPEVTWFEVQPGQMYPAMVRLIRGSLAHNEVPDGALVPLWESAAQVTERGWNLALMPRDACVTFDDVAQRTRALETCRLWFTELLHRSVDGQRMGLRITKDERYRL